MQQAIIRDQECHLQLVEPHKASKKVATCLFANTNDSVITTSEKSNDNVAQVPTSSYSTQNRLVSMLQSKGKHLIGTCLIRKGKRLSGSDTELND